MAQPLPKSSSGTGPTSGLFFSQTNLRPGEGPPSQSRTGTSYRKIERPQSQPRLLGNNPSDLRKTHITFLSLCSVISNAGHIPSASCEALGPCD